MTVPCQDFGVTVDGLPEDTYEVDVALVDAAANQVSDTVTISDAAVVGGTDLTVSIDFSASTIH